MTSGSAGDVAVRCAGVHHSFGDVAALRGIDLTVRRGTVHGLVGPNGAGKSTVLRLLLGLLRPDAGTVAVLGVDPAGGGRALDGVAGFVDTPRFYPYLAVGRTLGLLAQLDGGDAPGRVAAALDAVGLTAAARRRVATLSTGNRQRLALAAALVRDPAVLVVDEPTTGLDPAGIADLHTLVRDLADDGRTVLLSSHDMTGVDRSCDDVTVLRSGRVAHTGSLADLRARAGAGVHRLHTADDGRAARLLAAAPGLVARPAPDGRIDVVGDPAALDAAVLHLAGAGIAVRELVPVRSALEVEFSRLVGTP